MMMPIPEVENSWNVIQTMTATMRNHASAEEWVSVLDIAVARHQYLIDHFANFPVGPTNSEFYRERIHDMLRGEEELQALALEARKQVMRSALTNNQNNRAVGAYLKTSVR